MPASQVSQVTPSSETTASALTGTSSGSPHDLIPASALVTEAVLFFLFTGIIFALIRRYTPGVLVQRTLPALALSSLFALELSLIATTLLAEGAVPGIIPALIFMGAGTLLAAYLWHSGVMNRRIVLAQLALGTLAGFVFLAPIMPLELGGVINAATGTSAPAAGVLVICTVLILALVTGRTFCGTICPVGSLQELAYAVPLNKIRIQRTGILELVRLAVFGATVIAAVYLVDLMVLSGLYDLFSLTFSAGLFNAADLIVLSVFLYRPVCRLFCPFGLLFSLCAEFSLFRLRRTPACTACRKCEKACPARTAGADDAKRECYLCGRCTDACPVTAALSYRRCSRGTGCGEKNAEKR